MLSVGVGNRLIIGLGNGWEIVRIVISLIRNVSYHITVGPRLELCRQMIRSPMLWQIILLPMIWKCLQADLDAIAPIISANGRLSVITVGQRETPISPQLNNVLQTVLSYLLNLPFITIKIK